MNRHSNRSRWWSLAILCWLGLALAMLQRPLGPGFAFAQSRPPLTPGPTEGPPRPTIGPSPTASPGADPAALCLRLRASPNTSAAASGQVLYELAVEHTGGGAAYGVELALDYTPGALKLVDAAFSQPGAWVTDVRSAGASLRVETLRRGEVITASLRARTAAHLPPGSTVAAQARIEPGGGRDAATLSNRVVVGIGARPQSTAQRTLVVEPAKADSQATITFTLAGLAPRERVSAWLQRPDGSTTAVDGTAVDGEGTLRYSFSGTGLPPGDYNLVIFSRCSHIVGVGRFTIVQASATR